MIWGLISMGNIPIRNMDITEKLGQLLARVEGHDREDDMTLLSLGYWSGTLDFVDTEEAMLAGFEDCQKRLGKALGQPSHSDLAPRFDGRQMSEPRKYFSEYQSALRYTCWERDSIDIMLMITGHDADTLQFLTLAVSSAELDGI
jgi:hypothetical protein